ncbi:coenzyme F420 hydrogenase subunit beta [Methanocalculus sp. AMF5]|uniref:Coenzyme F420 hydrogenase/dehydrogenase, beta subunit C-terminal domain n=1 Tax=Methanocalculus sp. AMF5 TaxID=1198257 RepID=UPI00209E8794|nr:Coenzyme F420 hydrogenase/dehydrogenase, beta subunit C-terminal domain [Methanocalculus sp. AMF5]MCP1663172.1 coenzyme F420 hydrogenase subunit beta [Methanocalculus sp. AMF5]
MNPNKKLNFHDIDPKLCTYCGTCVGVCPNNVLIIRSGIIIIQDACNSCGFCYNICPGREVNFPLLNKKIFNEPNPDPYIGFYLSMHVAQSTNNIIRDKASSGGLVTTLLCHLLDTDQIDGAIVVDSDPNSVWKFNVKIARTTNEILNATQSKYTQIPLNEILNVIDKCEGRFAFVGLPCHIHGIRNLQSKGWKTAQKIKFCIGLFCGFNMVAQATEDILDKLKVKRETIISLKYRGGGHPGGFLVETTEGDCFLNKSYYNIYNLFYVPKRCLLCIDLTNELADISVGDIWLKNYSDGWSSVIIRSNAGKNLFTDLLMNDHIKAEEIDREHLFRSHSHLFKHKKEHSIIRLRLSKKTPYYGDFFSKNDLKVISSGLFYFSFFKVLNCDLFKKFLKILPLRIIEIVSKNINKIIRKGG